MCGIANLGKATWHSTLIRSSSILSFSKLREVDTARVGLRYSPTPNSDVLLSYIRSDVLDEVNFAPGFPFQTNLQGSQFESQYIYRGEWLNLVAGGGDTSVNELLGSVELPLIPERIRRASTVTRTPTSKFPKPVTWTLGVSYDDFEDLPIEVKKVNPKFGVIWDITSNLSLRAASFKWVKPPLIADRTLEPTQVSGFNQVFDNSNGDDTGHRAVGLDWRLTKQLFVGAEATWRDVEVPIEPATSVHREHRRILRSGRSSYIAPIFSGRPFPRVSVSRRSCTIPSVGGGLLASFSAVPLSLKTISVPVGVRYFDPSGFLAVYWQLMWIRKSCVLLMRSSSSDFRTVKTNFSIVDASIGWRFPKRLGIATLTVSNLFDQSFRYQDDSFREFRDEPSRGPYAPEREVVGHVTLYF